MDLERIHDDCVHMTVPTKFLKSWIQAHYADRVLACWAVGSTEREAR